MALAPWKEDLGTYYWIYLLWRFRLFLQRVAGLSRVSGLGLITGSCLEIEQEIPSFYWDGCSQLPGHLDYVSSERLSSATHFAFRNISIVLWASGFLAVIPTLLLIVGIVLTCFPGLGAAAWSLLFQDSVISIATREPGSVKNKFSH